MSVADLPAVRPARFWATRRTARVGRVAVHVAEVGAVAALMAWMVHARVRDLGVPLWIDEGISLGIAGHPLSAIPGLLREDGAPPLFYVILHGWTSLFGATPRSGHALSLTFAVLAVPAAWWAARAPFGPYAAVLAAALVALDPFAGTYAIEIRMYSLLLLTGLLACGTFVRAYALVDGDRRWAAAFAVALAATLYTHNWGLFIAAACGVAWLALLAVRPGAARRSLLIAGVIGFGGALALFAPWVPTVLYQARHTGAPWSHAPSWASVGNATRHVLGGHVPETVLLLLALAGAGTLLRPVSAPRARAALTLAAITVLTFAIAYAWSNLSSPAWATRYLAIVLAPMALVLAAGLSRLGPVAVVALAVVFLGTWYDQPTHASLAHKSNAAFVARRLGSTLPPGTLVFSTQPEQVPLLAMSLPPGLRYVTPLGDVTDPHVMDWRNAMDRISRPEAGLRFVRLVDALHPGQRLLLIQPRFGTPTAPWTRRVGYLAGKVNREVLTDPRLKVLASAVPHRGFTRATVSGRLLERTAAR
ncbi:MAG TPA: glycosyltransferase family 39 protein [Baekduia sp.]|uniref:glycosyltransferase family 39 protein n=1 Tax=Baekduia sp. TaxID=2600305 RepID=UPI002D78D898|nr:glycosyltransferase family 39 protein [Baekduia sp.]HET6508012.1 glycosyltransferase family 39 protein [Baekduia sp.]